MQVIEFLTELQDVEISPVTLLRSNSAREALLAILQHRKTHKNIFGEVIFSIDIDSKLDSELYPLKTFFWKFFMTCSF